MNRSKWKNELKKLGILMLAMTLLVGGMSLSEFGIIDVKAAKTNEEGTESNNESDESDVKEDKDTDEKESDETDNDNKGSEINNNVEDGSQINLDESDYEEPSVSSTSEFLIVGDCVPTATGRYGQPVHLILPIYNLGLETVTNLVITPMVSNKVEEWPFKLSTTGLVQVVDNVPASTNKEIAYLNRREVEWDLTVREDALTGYYPLEFNVTYYRDGSIESTTLQMYVYIQGAKGTGSLEGTDSDKISNPRIIVTGFDTEPAEVYAGSTFKLIVHLQNTASDTEVSNIMFDLEAAQEGIDESSTYAAFLPTSGSSTIFKDFIAPGAYADIEIEMTAKADLSQKPYILDIRMEYEDDQKNSYSATSNVSIPVKQVAKFDVSSFDVMPESISVGSESNVMFSIYNTGKTTLYNTKVTFEAASITGGDTFIGKIEPGGTGSVDAMLMGQQMTEDDGKVKVIISYEDEAGNVSTDERELELFVSEEMFSDEMFSEDMMYDEMSMDMEEEGTSKVGLVIGIIAIVIVVGVVVLIVILKIRKKRKADQELADDLDDLLNDFNEENK